MTGGAESPERAAPSPPQALLDAVDGRCRALASAASGRVFELAGPGADAALAAESQSGARHDTIVSLMGTSQVADLADFVAALDRILDENGWILMVEPLRTGTAGRRAKVWSRLFLRRKSAREGLAGTDIVSALRAAGFMVTDLDRFEAPTLKPPWRRCVELRARRQTPQAEASSAAGPGPDD